MKKETKYSYSESQTLRPLGIPRTCDFHPSTVGSTVGLCVGVEGHSTRQSSGY